MYIKKSVFGFMLTFLLLFTSVSFAQVTTGNIEGTVKDQNDAVIPGATVTVVGVDRGFRRTVTTKDDGTFLLVQVPQGTYKVTSSRTGFRDRSSEVQVALGQTSSLSVTLEAGSGQVVVDVKGDDVAVIDIENNKIQTNINERRTELTPKASVNFAGVLRVSPAVREEPLGAGFQIDGSSGAENTFIVDGLEVTNFRTGQLRNVQNIANDAVSEVQVKTSGFNAEFGGATGGVINVVSKGGDNQYHGQFGTQFEVSGLNSDTRQILRGVSDRTEFITPGGNTFLNPPDTEFTNFFPTARIGGPIIKDRLWFFVSAAPQFRNQERVSVFPDGSTETNERELRNDYYFARLDGQIGNTLNLTGTYSYSPQSERGNLLGFGAGGSSGDLSDLGGRVNVQNFTYAATWTPTSNFVLSGRGGRNFLNEKDGAYGVTGAPARGCRGSQTVLNNFPGFGCPNGQVGDISPLVFNTVFDISIRNTFDIDASYIVDNFFGRHIFKGGYQLNKIENDVNQSFVGGIFRFFFGQTQRGVGDVNTGVVTFTNFGTIGNTSSQSEGIYIQDSWSVNSRLSLNLGVRFDKEDVPSFSANGVPIEFGYGDKIAPRLGFAYDLTGDGKTKIFASYGWFYDRFKYELPRGLFGGDTFLRIFATLDPNISAANYTAADVLNAPDALTLNFRVPSNDPSDNRVDPDLEAQRQSEFTVGFEREIIRNFVLRARYTHKQLDQTIEDVGFFDNAGNENFFIANPGQGIVGQPFATGIPATPEAERKYDAVEFTLDKRFADSYFFNATYTYSRLFGNYSGLASSDELGRSSPNVNRFFDLPFLGFDLNGNPNNGRLATDRPHAVKVFGGYVYEWSSTNATDFTAAFIGQSGTPLSTQISFFNANTFVNGRGDLGRTETFTQTDFAVTHRYKFGRDNKFGLAFEVNLINLFNQEAVTNRFTTLSVGSLSGQDQGFDLFSNCPGVCDELNAIRAVFAGGIRDQVLNLLNNDVVIGQTNGVDVIDSLGSDGRFNAPLSFQIGRQVRFGMRFSF